MKNKWRTITLNSLTLLLILICLNTISLSEKQQVSTINAKNSNFPLIENITIEDDRFHNINKLRPEWWYFDAHLDNGYIVQLGYLVLSTNKFGIISPSLNVYDNSTILYHNRKFLPMNSFTLSTEGPLITYNWEQVMEGYIDQNTSEWKYNVKTNFGQYQADLQFIGNASKGWKISPTGGEWAVILPRAHVQGTLTLNGETIRVNGTGYHDHNWDIKIPMYEIGYIWGKIPTDHFNLVFAIIEKKEGNEKYAIISMDPFSNELLNPNDIDFTITEYMNAQGKIIPKTSLLTIENKAIDIHLTFETQFVHHQGLFTRFFRRLFVTITGDITYKGVTDTVDMNQFIEQIRFQ